MTMSLEAHKCEYLCPLKGTLMHHREELQQKIHQKMISCVCEKILSWLSSKSSVHKYVLNVFCQQSRAMLRCFSIWTARSFHLHAVKDRITPLFKNKWRE